MTQRLSRHAPWIAGWLLATVAGGWLLAQWHLRSVEGEFTVQAETIERLLNQRTAQQETLLSSLGLLPSGTDASRAVQRPPPLPRQVIGVQRRSADTTWPDPQLQAAEAESRKQRRAVLAQPDLPRGRYVLLLAGETTSEAISVDLHAMVPWDEWPVAPVGSVVRVTLQFQDQYTVLQSGGMQDASDGGWHFARRSTLTTASQPFEVRAERHVDWGDLPWSRMTSWSLLVALLLLAARALLRLRKDNDRAADLLRLGEATRLSTLAELGAGMAHELNQPLATMVAGTEAAQRHLADDPPDVAMAQVALLEVTDQAMHAAQVLQRLRRAAETPDVGRQTQDVDLHETARKVLNMLEAEVRRRGVEPDLKALGPPFRVRAHPMALEQVVHSLLMNAMQALDLVPPPERRLWLVLEADHSHGRLSVQDNGPGIRNEDLPHVFEPFFSTRNGGLGLGLSFSESLATGMGGTLMAFNRTPRGAEFVLRLPLAATP